MNVLCDICKDSDHACIKALRKEVERLEGIIKTASAYLEHIEGPRCRVPAGTWSVATRISAARVALDSANHSHHAEPRPGGDSVNGVVGSLNQEGAK